MASSGSGMTGSNWSISDNVALAIPPHMLVASMSSSAKYSDSGTSKVPDPTGLRYQIGPILWSTI